MNTKFSEWSTADQLLLTLIRLDSEGLRRLQRFPSCRESAHSIECVRIVLGLKVPSYFASSATCAIDEVVPLFHLAD